MLTTLKKRFFICLMLACSPAMMMMMPSCISKGTNSLNLHITTNLEDTLKYVNADFYIRKRKLESADQWKMHPGMKKIMSYGQISPDSFNTFNFQQLKEGNYMIILHCTFGNRRRAYLFDSIQVHKGYNTATKNLILDTNVTMDQFFIR